MNPTAIERYKADCATALVNRVVHKHPYVLRNEFGDRADAAKTATDVDRVVENMVWQHVQNRHGSR